MKAQKIRKVALVLAAGVFALGAASVQAVNDTSPSPDPSLASPAAPMPSNVADVLKMDQAKVADDTIVAFIQNSGTTYHLDANQIIYLRDHGLSDAVLTAMLQSGPAAAPENPQTPNGQTQTPDTTPPAPPDVNPGDSSASGQPTVIYVNSAPVYYYPAWSFSWWWPVGVTWGWAWWGGCWHWGCHNGGGFNSCGFWNHGFHGFSGFHAGFHSGFNQGFAHGFNHGFNQGINHGFNTGFNHGMNGFHTASAFNTANGFHGNVSGFNTMNGFHGNVSVQTPSTFHGTTRGSFSGVNGFHGMNGMNNGGNVIHFGGMSGGGFHNFNGSGMSGGGFHTFNGGGMGGGNVAHFGGGGMGGGGMHFGGMGGGGGGGMHFGGGGGGGHFGGGMGGGMGGGHGR